MKLRSKSNQSENIAVLNCVSLRLIFLRENGRSPTVLSPWERRSPAFPLENTPFPRVPLCSPCSRWKTRRSPCSTVFPRVPAGKHAIPPCSTVFPRVPAGKHAVPPCSTVFPRVPAGLVLLLKKFNFIFLNNFILVNFILVTMNEYLH